LAKRSGRPSSAPKRGIGSCLVPALTLVALKAPK